MSHLKRGSWLTEMKNQMIAGYVGRKYAVVANNGTVSLAIAMMVIGIKRDDEVIMSDPLPTQ